MQKQETIKAIKELSEKTEDGHLKPILKAVAEIAEVHTLKEVMKLNRVTDYLIKEGFEHATN